MLECLVALVVLSCMCQLFQLMIQQSFIGNQYLKTMIRNPGIYF